MFFHVSGSGWRRKAICLPAVVFICMLSAAVGCSKKSNDGRQGTQVVQAFVSIQPQADFVRRIGGRHVGVEVLVRPGCGPHNYEPTAKQLARLAEADVFFRIGVPFENRLMKKITAAMPSLNIVDTRKGIKLRKMQPDGHGKKQAGRDPHIWMNPRLVKLQSATICQALKKLDPKHAKDYDRNLEKFQADLDRLDAKIAESLAPMKGRTFFVFHPALGYFADAYGLEQRAVEIEGKSPSARQLGELIAKARADDVKVIFVSPQFSSRSARRVAKAIGGVVVPIDPLAEDYIKNMTSIAEKIRMSNRIREHELHE